MLERQWDVLVVGGGPGGIAAAVRSAEAGRSVALVDSNSAPGGQIWRLDRGLPKRRSPVAAQSWLARLQNSGVEVLGQTTIVHATAPSNLYANSPAGPLRLSCKRLILATGARELFLPFPGWTLPQVCGVGGLQALVKGGWDVRGRSILLAGSGPLLLAVAADLKVRGAHIVGLAEQAPFHRLLSFGLQLARHPGKVAQLAQMRYQLRGVPQHFSTWPIRALGKERVEAVVLRSDDGAEQTVEVDIFACGFGLVPNTRLARLLGCAQDEGSILVDREQRTSLPDVFCVGEATGIGGADLALVEGETAGLVASGRTKEAASLRRIRRKHRRFAKALEKAFALRDELHALPEEDTLVCRCEDVPWHALNTARDLRDAKLHTRCGMGPCQGRVCGPALSFLCGFHSGPPRPPLFPVAMDFFAEMDFPTPPSTDGRGLGE